MPGGTGLGVTGGGDGTVCWRPACLSCPPACAARLPAYLPAHPLPLRRAPPWPRQIAERFIAAHPGRSIPKKWVEESLREHADFKGTKRGWVLRPAALVLLAEVPPAPADGGAPTTDAAAAGGVQPTPAAAPTGGMDRFLFKVGGLDAWGLQQQADRGTAAARPGVLAHAQTTGIYMYTCICMCMYICITTRPGLPTLFSPVSCLHQHPARLLSPPPTFLPCRA